MPQKTPLILQILKAATNRNRSLSQKISTLAKLLVILFKKTKRIRVVIKPTGTWRHLGWGMASNAALPWDRNTSTDEIGIEFSEVNQDLLNRIQQNRFILSQWEMIGKTYAVKPAESLDVLSWRHYLCYWTAKYSARSTRCSRVNLIEAGVCDGLTINFAISAVESELGEDSNFEVFLYDSWGAMKDEYLTSKEKFAVGDYGYLSIEQTKKNLEKFEKRCSFIKGYIPEIFKESPGPNEISWIHIDLNSSMPTSKTLEQFLPRLLPGGVVLFDDYGWHKNEETKEVADKICSKFEGLLMPYPTGQAIFFKH